MTAHSILAERPNGRLGRLVRQRLGEGGKMSRSLTDLIFIIMMIIIRIIIRGEQWRAVAIQAQIVRFRSSPGAEARRSGAFRSRWLAASSKSASPWPRRPWKART